MLQAVHRPLLQAVPLPLGAMGQISGLVPSRFLTLLAHLVVVITLFWSRVRPTATLLLPAFPLPGGPSPTPLLLQDLTQWGPPAPPLLCFLIALLALQDSNIQACLPLTFTPEEYEKQDIQ